MVATNDAYWVQNIIAAVPTAGTQVQLNDTAPTAHQWNFAAVEIVAAATVKTTPTITWAAPASITSGTALGGTQLNATASVPGTFVYTPPAGTILPVGVAQSLSVTFTPTDTTNYTNATASVAITVVRATPTITWAAPASITAGTALSATQLNATASVPGTFVYVPPAGTVLAAGAGQTLSVTFTPTNAVNYTTATASVTITVTPPAGSLAVGTIVFAEGSGTRTAGPFNTSAGDLVVAFAASSGPARKDSIRE